MNTSLLLQQLVEIIVRMCDPAEIRLFGSYAKGRAEIHSDIDLLVVVQDKLPFQAIGNEIEGRLRQFPIGVDVILVSQDELAKSNDNHLSFLNSIQQDYVSLYTKRLEKFT